MVKLSSQRENNANKNLIAILLCAGEGTRMGDLAGKITKPLIKIKNLNNISILEHSVNSLNKLGIGQIVIVKGHLGHKIDDFVTSLMNINTEFEEKLFVIDSKGHYKKGPLYSFLSITQNKDLFRKECVYIVMPGDTIFQFKLLNQIITLLLNNSINFQENPAMFYRKIRISDLKKWQVPKMVSTVDIEKKHTLNIVKKLEKQEVQSLSDSAIIRQTIPVFLFPYNFLNSMLNYVKSVKVNTIGEIVNELIKRGNNLIAVKISNDNNFYDIDIKSDIDNFRGFN